MAEIMTDTQVEHISTGIINAEPQDDFMVTRKAIETVNIVREQNSVPEDFHLRIGTRSGGCSGMSYTLGFDSEVHDTDRILESNDISLVIDNKSLFYLMGVTLDFVDGPSGSGFVFNNPNNAHTCGCAH